jgi:hypothetical protein
MKPSLSFSFRLFCSVMAVSALIPREGNSQVTSDADREFQRLTLDRERALSAAVDPINRRYKAALEALMRRATQANDLETALKLKQAIEQVPVNDSGKTIADLVGIWKFENKTDGARLSIELKADYSAHVGGVKSGSWQIKGRQLILAWDKMPGNQDKYELVGRANRMDGQNSIGHALLLTK